MCSVELTCAPLVEWSLVQRWYRVPRYRKGNTQRREGELQPITAQHHHTANHSSASPSSQSQLSITIQPITAHLAVSRVDTKHCSVTASSRASRGDATSRKSRFTLFKLKHYYYYIIIFNVLPYLQSDV